MEGLANICVIKGTARPHVDFHIKLDWETKVGGTNYKGSLELPEMTIAGARDGTLEIIDSFQSQVSMDHAGLVKGLQTNLRAKVVQCLTEFIAEFSLK